MSRFNLGRRSVNRLGYGAMRLTGSGVFGPPRDRDEAVVVLRAAVEAGVDHIDLAWALDLAPNVLLIPGMSSLRHLAENLAAAQAQLDEQARHDLGDRN
jgi:aryl-alcohol dehydrogenase-like predicted oxidoreductase